MNLAQFNHNTNEPNCITLMAIEESRLLALPAELRNKIYEFVLGAGESYVREIQNEYRSIRTSPELLRTSVQLLVEAHPIFHRNNSFRLVADFYTGPSGRGPKVDLEDLPDFEISRIIATRCVSMKNVTFDIRVLWLCAGTHTVPVMRLLIWLEGGELRGSASLEHSRDCMRENGFGTFLKAVDKEFGRMYHDAAAAFGATNADLVVHPPRATRRTSE